MGQQELLPLHHEKHVDFIWLIDYYKSSLEKYFEGNQRFGRADDFLDDLLLTPSCLKELEDGRIKDQPAPKIAIDYWNLPLHSTLKDVVRVVRDDEAGHRDVNHSFANLLNEKKSNTKEATEKKEAKSIELK